MKKLGKGQETLLFRTLSLVVYTLAKEGPLTAYGIHRKTKIHRTTVLPRALHVLTKTGVIIKRRPTVWAYPLVHENDPMDSSIMSRYKNNEYYLLNWSHKDAKTFYTGYKDEIKPYDPLFDYDYKEQPQSESEKKYEVLEKEIVLIMKRIPFDDKMHRHPLDFLIYIKLRSGFPDKGKHSYIAMWEHMERTGILEYIIS